METQFRQGTKIGYLNPQNGRYMWGVVVDLCQHSKTGMQAVKVKTITKQGRRTWEQIHEDETANLIRWNTEQSIDWKTPKTYVKIKF